MYHWQQQEEMIFAICLFVFLGKETLSMHQCWWQQEEKMVFVSCVWVFWQERRRDSICELCLVFGKRGTQHANTTTNNKRRWLLCKLLFWEETNLMCQCWWQPWIICFVIVFCCFLLSLPTGQSYCLVPLVKMPGTKHNCVPVLLISICVPFDIWSIKYKNWLCTDVFQVPSHDWPVYYISKWDNGIINYSWLELYCTIFKVHHQWWIGWWQWRWQYCCQQLQWYLSFFLCFW